MVRYWRRAPRAGWRRRALRQRLGAVATGLVAGDRRLDEVPAGRLGGDRRDRRCSSLGFYGIRRHYRGSRAGCGPARPRSPPRRRPRTTVLVTCASSTPATREAVWFARAIAGDDFRGDPRAGSARARPRSARQLVGRLRAARRSSCCPRGDRDAVLEQVWTRPRGESQFVTVVVPEQFRRPSLLDAIGRDRVPAEAAAAQRAERRRSPTSRRSASRRRRAAGAPSAACSSRAPTPPRCARSTTRRASSSTTRGPVFFAFDRDEAKPLRRDWERARRRVPLEVVEAPYRDLGDPLLAYVRGLTADPGTLAVVVMPELVVRGWRGSCTTSARSTSSGCSSSSRA